MSNPGSDIASLRQRRDHLTHLLERALAVIEAEVRRCMRARGYEIAKVYRPVVDNVSLDGSRITEIADRAGLSKQTIGPLVRDLEGLGILRVDPDPNDGRAKLVRYTELGLEALVAGLESAESVERSCALALGAGGLSRLKRDLETVIGAVEGTDDVRQAG